MKPIKSNRTQEGCTPVSSNCVIWQGPNIPCIDLCEGDSISDVTYKLALELCDIMDQLDITTFDLSCFDPVCPTPKNFHDLIQFLIDQLCACCITNTASGSNPSADTGGTAGRPGASGDNCPDCMIDVAPCFYTTNEFGDVITQMQLTDYARAIGARICTLSNSIANINIILNNQQIQITNIINDINALPIPIPLPTFVSTCLTDKIAVVPPGGIALVDMVNAIQDAFCELRTATGMPNDILSSILKQCVSLDTSPSMNLPGVSMGSLPGWKLSGSYATLADSVNNMWITICDMRAAITTIMNNCCPQGCEGLVVNLAVTFTAPSTINFWWTGDATGFEDCNPAGSLVTITDAYGNSYTTRIPITVYMNLPYALNISGTPLNPATNLHINVEACWENLTTHSTCERCIEADIINQSICPALSLSADSSTILYSFNNIVTGTVTYTIELRLQSDNSLIDTQVVVTSTPGLISNTFTTGVLPGIVYLVSITVTIAGVVTNTCPVGVITTLPLTCNPPVEVSGEASSINPIT